MLIPKRHGIRTKVEASAEGQTPVWAQVLGIFALTGFVYMLFDTVGEALWTAVMDAHTGAPAFVLSNLTLGVVLFCVYLSVILALGMLGILYRGLGEGRAVSASQRVWVMRILTWGAYVTVPFCFVPFPMILAEVYGYDECVVRHRHSRQLSVTALYTKDVATCESAKALVTDPNALEKMRDFANWPKASR